MSPEKRDLLGGGTRHHYPHGVFGRVPGASRDTTDYGVLQSPRFRCDWFEDFLGDLSSTDLGVTGALYDISVSGTPTNAVLADAAHGQLQVKLASTNELEIVGYSWNDQQAIPANAHPVFEARIAFKTLPTTNERAIFGLASALAGAGAAWDNVATNLWFRFEANGLALAETDDGTTDNDDQSTGVTLVVDTWYTLSIHALPNGIVQFWIADAYGANDRMVKELSAGALDTTTLQPVALLMKDSGTGVPDVRIDSLRAEWTRRVTTVS